MTKLEKFDDKVKDWYTSLLTTNKVLFILMFPIILIADILLIIPRIIDKKIYAHRNNKLRRK